MKVFLPLILLCCCVVITWITDVHAQGCTYGGSPDCVFPCNCADESEVCDEDTGHCTSQCKDGHPKGFRWSGPGCRVGNVAYGKNATSKGTYRRTPFYQASNAVDGDTTASFNHGYCFHSGPVSGYTGRYWWYVDLGATHIIYNVTIFERSSSYGHVLERLQNFSVYVSDSDTSLDDLTASTCAYHGGYIGNGRNVTLQCNTTDTLLGRYVSVVNPITPIDHHHFALCEVVVIGTQAINCSLCGEKSKCDPLHGCQTCPPGKRTPDCTKGLEPATTYHVEDRPYQADIDNDLTEPGEPTQVISATTVQPCRVDIDDDLTKAGEPTQVIVFTTDNGSVPVVAIVAALAVAVVLLTVIVVVLVTLYIRQRKSNATLLKLMQPETHSLQSLQNDVAAGTENRGCTEE